MGLLALGTPLDWAEAKGHAGHVREHGIEQFLQIWHRLKDRTGDQLLWGDEVCCASSRASAKSKLTERGCLPLRRQIEYMVISYDDEGKNARLSLRQTEILEDLQRDAVDRKKTSPGRECVLSDDRCAGLHLISHIHRACIPVFHPEYGRYMLESTPGAPYGATLEDLLSVEGNMVFR